MSFPKRESGALQTVDRSPDLPLEYLQDTLGEAAGKTLFKRLDRNSIAGDVVKVTTTRAARQMSAKRITGHAMIVADGRRAETLSADETMVMISLSDLAAVVKPEFDWAAAFRPRPDLPAAVTPLSVRTGRRRRDLIL